jgi:hypothetical protein
MGRFIIASLLRLNSCSRFTLFNLFRRWIAVAVIGANPDTGEKFRPGEGNSARHWSLLQKSI